MCYKNGKDILPERLLKELQKYIQGETLYIPKNEERKAWGESNGTRIAIRKRNLEIYNLYKKGTWMRRNIKTAKKAACYNLLNEV